GAGRRARIVRESVSRLGTSFKRLRGLIVIGPVLTIAVLEYSRWALAPWLTTWTGHLLMDGVVLVGAVFFYAIVSTVIGDLMARLEGQNRELVALRSAGLDITSDLSLDGVLRKIVEQAKTLLDCRYGALAVYAGDGTIESFVTAGVDGATRASIGAPPSGRGLLSKPLRDGRTLRLGDIGGHPDSVGFPENHPPMQSLLAVPVVCREPFRGNLYLSEKLDGADFTADDEKTLTRFALQAAIAVDNAQLHAKVAAMAVMKERLHLAHEMHDGQAQVLAYVNTKAQVVDQLMASGEVDAAREHLAQMAEAAREVYADVREGILGLRTAIDQDHDLAPVLREYALKWQDQCGIPIDVEIETAGGPTFDPETELQIVRVVQEALANVRKHSRADRAWLKATVEGDRLHLHIRDDGVGFDPGAVLAPGALERFGLKTMRERCRDIGATLDIDSAPGRGTRLHFSLR
ncbi:MAG: GAF domain-containing sensor histidine kinase, partial [Acidobacteriota bacterium]